MKIQIRRCLFILFLLTAMMSCHKQKISSELEGDWNIQKSSFKSLQEIYGYSQNGIPVTKTARKVYFKSGNIGVSKDPLAVKQIFENANYRIVDRQIEIYNSGELNIDGIYSATFTIREETNLIKKIRLELKNDSIGYMVLYKTYLKSDLFR